MDEEPFAGASVSIASLLETLPCAVSLHDREFNYIAVNARWERDYRVSRVDVVGRTYEYVAGSPPPPIFPDILRGKRRRYEAFPIRRHGGVVIPVDLSLAPWYDAAGAIAGLMISTVDLTEAESPEVSERAEERLRAAIDLAGIYVYEFDHGHSWSAGSTAALSDDPIIRETFMKDRWATVHPDDRDAVKTMAREQLQSHGRYVTEYRLNRSDKDVWVRGGAISIPRGDGVRPRVIGVIQDVTERKSAELAAARANAAKSNFLATMSHEIRTPLNGVLGMVQAMFNDPLPEAQRRRLEVIRQSGEILLAVVNDVLDLSKIEAGKLEIEYVDFSPAKLIRDVLAAFDGSAREKGLSLEQDVDKVSGVYRGDPTRLRQVSHNLISNALKFTESGSITVSLAPIETGLELVVSDTGIGIPRSKLKTLFHDFSQVDASITRRFGGTGLGLAICRRLVELMGGTIDVESELGQGSAFTVDLPMARVGDEEPQGASTGDANADGPPPVLRILAAEDNEINQLVLKTLLSQAGLEPTIVADGAAAVESWRTSSFDVILMDIHMPVMDGLTATAAIRGAEGVSGLPRTPIIALTADAMSHQVAEYLAAGMDGHVAKPIDAQRLFAAIEAAVINADQASSASALLAQDVKRRA
jgi:PAS domain S-box-containing protein